jgi:hypothetical protein
MYYQVYDRGLFKRERGINLSSGPIDRKEFQRCAIMGLGFTINEGRLARSKRPLQKNQSSLIQSLH